jgi:plasmid maintenance system antidote protein VapI
MRTIQDYLDLAKQIKKIDSDYALAKAMGVTQQEVSFIRNGERKINDTIATKLALLIGIDPMEIITSANYWHGSERNKQFWEWYNQQREEKKNFLNIKS